MLVLKLSVVRKGALRYQIKFLLTTSVNHRCDTVVQVAKGEADLAQLCCCEISSDVSFVVIPGLRVVVGSSLHTAFCHLPLNESRLRTALISGLMWLNTLMYLLPANLRVPLVFYINTSLHESVGEDFFFPVKVCWDGSWGQLIPSIMWCCAT